MSLPKDAMRKSWCRSGQFVSSAVRFWRGQ